MREQTRYQLWIVAAAGVVFFTNLGATGLWDMDEALYASCAREMCQRADWVVPWFNGQMFPEKPPLMFWTMIAGFQLIGVNELGARFFSAVFGVATALCAFHLGRVLFSPRAGLWAGLVTATTIVFTISARAATVDSALTLATTAAFFLFVLARSDARNAAPAHFKLRYAIPMYACIGLTVLAKGPVGMLLPLAAMGLYLLGVDGWRNLLRSALWMRPMTAIVVVSAVVLPWCVLVWIRTDGQWLRQFIFDFNLRPFKQPFLSHGDVGSPYLHHLLAALVSIAYYLYYIPAILVGFFPWSVFLGPTLVDAYRRVRKNDRWRDGCLLAACWFGVWFVFWSLCKTKLPHYPLPAYPAMALLMACFVERWQSRGETAWVPLIACWPVHESAETRADNQPMAHINSGQSGHCPDNAPNPADSRPFPAWWLRNAWLSLILVGLGMIIAVPIVATVYLGGHQWLGLIGLILLLGGAWCWWNTAHNRHRQALVGMAVTGVVFLTAIFGFAALRVDKYQNGRPMTDAIRADGGADSPIATYRFFRESTVYYAGHPATRCDGDEQTSIGQLSRFLAEPNRSYVVTTNQYEPEIERHFPGQFDVIFRQPRFLAPGEMIVLAHPAKLPVP
jgi:4-amino-4-deoxy-L-arabinose transferase-like glycosyltransferase